MIVNFTMDVTKLFEKVSCRIIFHLMNQALLTFCFYIQIDEDKIINANFEYAKKQFGQLDQLIPRK